MLKNLFLFLFNILSNRALAACIIWTSQTILHTTNYLEQ